MWSVLLLAFVCTCYSQSSSSPSIDICSEESSKYWPTKSKTPRIQKVLVAQIGPDYTADLLKIYNDLATWAPKTYPGTVVDWMSLQPSTAIVTKEVLSRYTQVWMLQVSTYNVLSANQQQTYINVANWFRNNPMPHGPELIVDARVVTPPLLFSSDPNWPLNHRSYFYNLAVRGGGLIVGTDSSPYAAAGNFILARLGVAPITGYDSGPSTYKVDPASPFIAAPFTGSGDWHSHFSSGNTPQGLQNGIGKSLYPVTFNSKNVPGISSTIRGSWGWQAKITSPSCGAHFNPGQVITFTSTFTDLNPTALGGTATAYKWYLLKDGTTIGTTAAHERALPVGHHTIVLEITNNRGFADRAFVSITVKDTALGSDNWGQCLLFARNGGQNEEVVRFHAIQASDNGGKNSISYYNYLSGESQSAIVKSGVAGAHFYMYKESNGELTLNHVMHRATKVTRFGFSIASAGLAETTQNLLLLDDPADAVKVQWHDTRKTLDANWDFTDTTKGFVLGNFANDLPPVNNQNKPWCVSFNFTNVNYNTPFINVWGKGTTGGTSLSYNRMKYNVDFTSLVICRANCFCPGNKFTSINGALAPIKVKFGNGGRIGGNYNDNTPCLYTIEPAVAAGRTTPVQIGVSFNSWSISAGDTITIKSSSKPTADLLSYSDNNKPDSFLTTGPSITVDWKPNGNGLTNGGWELNYAVVPTFSGYDPTIGKTISHTDVTITGTDFSRDMKVRVAGCCTLGVNWISSTKVVVRIPGHPTGQTTIEISNDGIYWTNTKNPWNWFDQKCSEVTSCRDCNTVHICNWCEDPITSTNSKCVDATVPCPPGAPAGNSCALAANYNYSIKEGDQLSFQVITARFIPQVKDGKVTIVKLPSLGSVVGITSAGMSIQAREGYIPYKAPYIGSKTPQTTTFTYQLTTLEETAQGVVTMTINPLFTDRIATVAEVNSAYVKMCNFTSIQYPSLPSNFKAYTCSCPKGFANANSDTKVRSQCNDINECISSPCFAPATCQNLEGTFKCNCPAGYKPEGVVQPTLRCAALPCPLTPWEITTKSKKMDLPRELASWAAQRPVWNLESVPESFCSACINGTYSRGRIVDKALFNSSPLCASAVLNQTLPCSYPCRYPGTGSRLDFFYNELTRTKFDVIVFSAFTKLDVAVAPLDKGAKWATFLLEDCKESTINIATNVIIGPLVEDMYGTGKNRPAVELASVRFPGSKCNLLNVYFFENCGDNKTTFLELCDDGNSNNGDGCSSTCLVEPGHSCFPIDSRDPISPSKCCVNLSPTGQTSIEKQLVCTTTGWWKAYSETATKDKIITVENDFQVDAEFKICGDIQLGVSESGGDAKTLTVDGTTLYIAGSLTVGNNGHVILTNGGKIVITDHCTFGATDKTEQLVFHEESWLTIDNIDWVNKDPEVPLPSITTQRCVRTDGTIEVTNVTAIPSGSHTFPLITTDNGCVMGRLEEESDAFHTHEHHGEMPGGCSNFGTERNEKDDRSVEVRFNYKQLCPGSIAGIVIAVLFTVAVIGGMIAVLGGGASSGGSSADYVAL